MVAAAVPSGAPPAASLGEPLAASAEEYEPIATLEKASDSADEDRLYPGASPGPGSSASASAEPPRAGPLSGSEAASVEAASLRDDLALRIDAHGTVWLSITADGARQWQGTMRANQSREVQAAESVRLTVGDAGAVNLTLNGKLLPGLGQPGEVRNLTITARDAAETSP